MIKFHVALLLAALSLFPIGCPGQPLANRVATPPGNSPAGGAASSGGEPFPFDIVPQLGHSWDVTGISISKTGKVAATASNDKTVRVWNVETGIMLRQLLIGKQAYDVAFLNDGERAAVVSWYEVQLWDVLHGQRLASFETFKSHVARCRILHGSDRMVVGYRFGGVELWDLAQKKRIRRLAAETPGGPVTTDVDVSFDDRSVAVSSENGTIKLVDIENGRLLRTLTGHAGSVRAARFSKNGETLTSFGDDGTMRQWEVRSGREVRSRPFGAPISTGALVNDGTAIVSGEKGAPKVIDLTTGREVRRVDPWPGGRFEQTAVIAVTADGRRSVSGDRYGSVLFSNLDDGSPIHGTPPRRDGPLSLAVSPRADMLAASFDKTGVDVWDAVLGARVRQIPNAYRDGRVSALGFSSDGRLLLGTEEQQLFIWDARSGKLLTRTQAAKPFFSGSLAVSPNGQLAAVGGPTDVAVFEIPGGRHLWTASQPDEIRALAFSPDNGRLVAGSAKPEAAVYDARTGARLFGFGGMASGPESVAFLDPSTVLIGANDGLGLWDLRSGKPGLQYTDASEYGGVAAFTVDRKWVLSGTSLGLLAVFDAHAGTFLRPFTAHANWILSIVPTADGKLVFSASNDGTIRVTPIATLAGNDPDKDPRPMVWVADGNDWLAYAADGYFDASRRGGSLAAAVRGFDGFRIDQLAARNNRPDVALGRIGLGTTEALSLFASRYKQRLRRLGFDEAALSRNLLSAPRASIVDFSVKGRWARLHCTFSGNGRQLKRWYVFVNNVALGDGEGTPVSGAEASVDLDIELSSGNNKVEVSVLDDVGVESLRDVRTANVTEHSPASLYYLGFGVSTYADPRLALKYANKDATDLGRALKPMTGSRGFAKVFVRTLTDSQVTKSSIAAARQFLLQAKVDDTVIVFVAGHGVFANGQNEQYYFVAHDTDISRIHETGVPFGLIEDLVTGIRSRNKLLLLDTCESGERDGEDETVRVSAGRSRGLAARGIRPAVIRSGQTASPNPKMGVYQDRFIFNDLSRRSGTIVFSASHGNELSYEDDRLQNGMFTYELVRALGNPSADADRNGVISTDELRAYVTQKVTARTQGLQNPTVDRDNIEALFGFPLLPAVSGQR
jgi:WD40 repeat protein/uncharacterized caspase-like protein